MAVRLRGVLPGMADSCPTRPLLKRKEEEGSCAQLYYSGGCAAKLGAPAVAPPLPGIVCAVIVNLVFVS